MAADRALTPIIFRFGNFLARTRVIRGRLLYSDLGILVIRVNSCSFVIGFPL
jgi:hypothetical protein